ncbi:MAG: DUF1573 domain-containing protein [Bacteroidetes bacterium]|nr:DUF1573 domain-containing protein [Bacteroidota bacterium]
MRRLTYFITIVIITGLFACSGEQGKIPADVVKNPISASGDQQNDLPVIAFDKTEHDFGKLIQGEKVTYNFKFKNSGQSDLLISQVHSSCGCTVPDFPREPIKPGDTGLIKVTFDSAGRSGIQNKSVTIVSNCQPNKTVVRIKAKVINP